MGPNSRRCVCKARPGWPRKKTYWRWPTTDGPIWNATWQLSYKRLAHDRADAGLAVQGLPFAVQGLPFYATWGGEPMIIPSSKT
eukprot:202487-Amphidinium_carterae.1